MNDSEPDFIGNAHVAIIGLGLMGGSLALALHGKCAALLGVDNDAGTLRLAKERKVFDLLSADPAAVLPSADVVVLAVPVNAIIRLIHKLPSLHPGSAVVLDLGSTKAAVCHAMQQLPVRFDPLGGHPMCGREKSGFACADPHLFQDAPFAFTSLEHTTPCARGMAESMARLLGAYPLWLDADTHDRWVAATSHLPYLLANTLAFSTPQEAAPMAASGFRSTTRLADSSIQMMLDILITNREQILKSIERFDGHLHNLHDLLLHEDFDSITALLEQGAQRHSIILGTNEEGINK